MGQPCEFQVCGKPEIYAAAGPDGRASATQGRRRTLRSTSGRLARGGEVIYAPPVYSLSNSLYKYTGLCENDFTAGA